MFFFSIQSSFCPSSSSSSLSCPSLLHIVVSRSGSKFVYCHRDGLGRTAELPQKNLPISLTSHHLESVPFSNTHMPIPCIFIFQPCKKIGLLGPEFLIAVRSIPLYSGKNAVEHGLGGALNSCRVGFLLGCSAPLRWIGGADALRGAGALLPCC